MSREVHVGVLASGRGSNFEALWAAQEAGTLGARIVCVLSDNPEARALERARELGLSTCLVDAGARRGQLSQAAQEEIVAFLHAQRVDLVCLAGFMRIVGRTILAAFPAAILNVHPSLLPSFPGLEAQRQALHYGVGVSGCTVHFVDAGVDTGPIIAQASVPVLPEDSVETLAARILEQEHRIYPLAVRAWAEGGLQTHGRRVHDASAAHPTRDIDRGNHHSNVEARS